VLVLGRNIAWCSIAGQCAGQTHFTSVSVPCPFRTEPQLRLEEKFNPFHQNSRGFFPWEISMGKFSFLQCYVVEELQFRIEEARVRGSQALPPKPVSLSYVSSLRKSLQYEHHLTTGETCGFSNQKLAKCKYDADRLYFGSVPKSRACSPRCETKFIKLFR
jgi:hypothetical protein